jgi:hypothetical protein
MDQNIQPTQAPAYPEQNLPQSTVAEAPASPAEASGMSQEEMRQNLQDLMEKIDNRYQDFSLQNFSSSNKEQTTKADALRMFFDMLQQAGVDPSNVEEVNAFLQKIKSNNPEIFKQIEAILKTLIEGEDMVQTEDTGTTSTPTSDITAKEGRTIGGGSMGQEVSQEGEVAPQSNMNM